MRVAWTVLAVGDIVVPSRACAIVVVILSACSYPALPAQCTHENGQAPCPTSCGADGAADCCTCSLVPGNAAGATLGGTPLFYRSYDAAPDGKYMDMSFPATVSDFRLDTYLVTVGRFRAFVAAGLGTQHSPPPGGAGAHDAISGSGWDPSWNSLLAADTAALQSALKMSCGGSTLPTWTNTTDVNEDLPINCITWYEAMAFCIWGGGYLPTEAEWNYAAAGGSEQRAFPWSHPAGSLNIDCGYANYFINDPSMTGCIDGAKGMPGQAGAPNRVGRESSNGASKWGSSDLGGNVAEWVLDLSNEYPTPCDDCANLTNPGNPAFRVVRGGSFASTSIELRTGSRQVGTPSGRYPNYGVRCARAP